MSVPPDSDLVNQHEHDLRPVERSKKGIEQTRMLELYHREDMSGYSTCVSSSGRRRQ